MKDKGKLKNLVQILGGLLKIDGNEWLVDEILKTIGEMSPKEEMAKHPLIQNIHEYCIEEIIEKQASDFYNSFPISEIKPQLIQDYKKMEHERRRDDFENFCLCVYQQIENITNFLFNSEVLKIWDKEKNKIAIKSIYDKSQKEYIKPKKGGTTLENLVFQGTDSPKWYANRKFRAVLYFFYFNANVTQNDYDFNSIYFIHEEIYQIRNQNHRGGEPSSYQKEILKKIQGNEARYYFKFYGFLQDFVNHIEKSYSLEGTTSHKNTKQKKSSIQKNTIGANNPVLEKLKQQMEKNK